MERILCAAIWDTAGISCLPQGPINLGGNGFVVCGLRHCDCVQTLSLMQDGVHIKQGCIHGFLTSKNRFVNRVEGLKIATKANQIVGEKHHPKDELCSEDLY